MHTFKTGMRYGLTAAIIVMLAGALHGCASDSPTDVSVQKQASSGGTCWIVNGQLYCT